ncbi:hypothetical protein A9A72_124236 [Stutzerimonas stutzeri]|uniref:Uncharacterized protein n=1 Tax=Stutzerimonas stutzeri TaxID=316 RepID=A0A5S5B6E6_STUST|nr:hypothetical protein A9A72_124236 [Stutzerimonas stutzeri]
MVILALAFMTFGGFGWDEPSSLLQVDVTPLGLKQFTDTAEGAQADPQSALDSVLAGRIPECFWPAGRAS